MIGQRHADDGRGWREGRRRRTMMAEMAFRVLQVITDPRTGVRNSSPSTSVMPSLVAASRSARSRWPRRRRRTGSTFPRRGARRLGWSTLTALRRELAAADVAVAHGAQTLPACALATIATSVPFVYRQISDSRFWASTPLRHAPRPRRAVSRRAGRGPCGRSGDKIQRSLRGRGRPRHRHPERRRRRSFPPTDAEDRAQARRELSTRRERFTFVSVGALVPEKGVDLAIEAVRGCTAAQLLVAGNGPEASDAPRPRGAGRCRSRRVRAARHRSDGCRRIAPPTPSCWPAAAATACLRCSSKRA